MTPSSELARALAPLRPDLVRFARLQLRNDHWAEDAVSETFIAILEKPDAFAGHSSLKTYVIGVLKHKIIDHLRTYKREVQVERDEDGSDEQAFDDLFLADGHFRETPQNWGEPDATLERQEFFEILQICIDRLPPNIGRIFMMREWLELETDEICKDLAITSSNCWVMLYRARMRLRECLEMNWFATPHPGTK